MTNTILQPDFEDKSENAIKFQLDNPDIPLAEFFLTYPARFPKDNAPSENDLKKSVSNFMFQPVKLGDQECVEVGKGSGSGLRDDLDGPWQEEQDDKPASSPREDEPSEYPEKISDNTAVRTAYRDEMRTISNFLRNGLSVLVVCDKMLTELIHEFVCCQAGREEVLDTAQPVETKQGTGSLNQALQGGQANPLPNLPTLIRDLKPGEVLVLRSLDMLDSPPMIELLYQRTAKGEKPQILAFLDPSLEAKKVLTDRFAVHVPIMGLPRHISHDDKRTIYTVTDLLTQKERACFARYDPEGLFKNVSGLNAVQFRNAMQYVGAMVEPATDPQKIYREIRQFKTSSSDEIEIPDTTFDKIGGYEHIKQQLIRTIALIAGPIQGMDEKQRGQLIPRGFVFHGPPGTGKTLFAKAIANEMNATIQMISGPEIMDKYVGESENNLRRIFATARRNAPAVVFFDEFDSIASQRSTYADGGARANNAVVAQFLTELDGFRQDQTMLIIGTTNRIDIIDEALLRPSRLRPIEIGLPDYAARKRVAEIHSESFGLDKLLKDICILASRHLKKSNKAEQDVPQAFLNALFAEHSPYKKRFQMEEQQAGFLRELKDFFAFVCQCRDKTVDQTNLHILDQVDGRIVELGKRYGLDLTKENLPSMDDQEAKAWLMPMQSDIRDLFSLLRQERRKPDGLAPETFLNAILDMVAEYTINFNNDEIRAIFQEASLEYHTEGQLITPRYIGQKIGLIRKRRDERQAVHLPERRR